MGTKTRNGRWLWQHTPHSAERHFLCSTAPRLLDFEQCLTLTANEEGVPPRFTRSRAFLDSWHPGRCAARGPVSLSLRHSVPFCLKGLDFFPRKRTFTPHLFLPHPPLTRHARGMMGVTQVEQDGFTSANVGNKMAQMRLLCTQHKWTRWGAT